MKKFIALLLALVMCIGLVACGNTNTPSTPSQDPTTPPPSESVTPPASEEPTPTVDPEPAPVAGDYVADAKSYVRAMYKDKAGKVLRDFDVVASVKIGEFTYDVTWTTDAAEENVKIGEAANNKITIDINEKPGEEDLVFTLTATVAADGKSESTTFEFYVPGTPAKADGPEFVAVPEVGGTYKFALVQGELGQTLFFTGAMSGNYLATSENPADAVDVTIEEVEGGVRLFFMDGETKTYIDIHEYTEGKAGVRLTTEPTAVFVWNEECGVYTAEVAGAPRYLGTYSTYNTMSASDIKYIAGENVGKIGISQFPAYFGTLSGSAPAAAPEKPAEPETPTEPEKPEEPVVSTDPAADSTLSVADALALGASKEHNTYTEGKYYVTGVISEVYNEQYGNMKIADENGNILTVYGTFNADGTVRYDGLETKPVAGDTITVYGIIGQYNDIPQIKNGWITEHTVATGGTTEPEEPVETPDEPEKPADPAADSTLSVVDALALGASKEHNTYTEGKYYVTGVITEVYNETYGNLKIADENGNILTVYGTYGADGTVRYDALETKPVAGDTITVYGIIGQYNDTPQLKNGWITEHTVAAGGTTEPEEPVVSTDPAADSTLSVVDALALGASKEHNTYTEGKYYVTGVITEVYNETYGNLKIADENGNILTVYGTYGADGTVRYDALETKPVAGDTITVYGIIGQYNDAPQIKNGWITAHTAAAPTEPDTTKRPTATKNVDPANLVGTWKMFAYDAPEGGYYTVVENEDLLLFGETSWTHMIDGVNANVMGLPVSYKWVDEDTIQMQNALAVTFWDVFMSDDGVLICRWVDNTPGVDANVEYYCVKISDEV